jgi:hypothetical protein
LGDTTNAEPAAYLTANEETEATTGIVEVRDEVPGYLGHPSPNRVS